VSLGGHGGSHQFIELTTLSIWKKRATAGVCIREAATRRRARMEGLHQEEKNWGKLRVSDATIDFNGLSGRLLKFGSACAGKAIWKIRLSTFRLHPGFVFLPMERHGRA